MKRIQWIAVLLIVAGVVLAYRGLNARRRSTILDIGRFQASVERDRVSPLTTIVGVAAVAGGIVLLVRGARKT